MSFTSNKLVKPNIRRVVYTFIRFDKNLVIINGVLENQQLALIQSLVLCVKFMICCTALCSF